MTLSGSEPTRRAAVLPALLFMAAMPLSLPNIYGAAAASAGFALLAFAAMLSFFGDSRLRFLDANNAPLRIVCYCVTAAYFWPAFIAGNGIVSFEFRSAANSLVLNAGATFLAMVVLAAPARRRLIVQMTVLAAAVVGFSGILTVALWKLFEPGFGLFATTSVGGRPTLEPVYLPLTTTLGVFSGLAGDLPRLVGYAREPGWMALYACVAYFLAEFVFRGKPLLVIRVGCILAVLGTFSTAGVGIFIFTWAFKALLIPKVGSQPMAGFLRQVAGLVAMGSALWIWVVLPGVGLKAKSELDPYSVGQRREATVAGWHALLHSPLGGGASEVVGGVNLIAAIAAFGLPFSLAIIAAMWLPRLRHNARSHTTAPILAVFLTVAFSQPPGDSLWMIISVMLIYGVTQISKVPKVQSTLAGQWYSHAGRRPGDQIATRRGGTSAL